MSGVLQKKLSKKLLCSAAILHLHPTSWLKDLSTVSTNLVVSYFVEDLKLKNAIRSLKHVCIKFTVHAKTDLVKEQKSYSVFL